MSEGERARWLLQSAAAATPRSSLELLNLRFPFSQLALMSDDEFAKQAERRRSKGCAADQRSARKSSKSCTVMACSSRSSGSNSRRASRAGRWTSRRA
jgi:hypothetical protein